MRCTTCDMELPQDVAFCPNCGARIQQMVSAPITTPLATPSPPPVYPSRSDIPQSAVPYAPNLPILPNSNTAAVSLVFGILAWVILPVIGAIVAIIAGHMARNEIARSNGQLGGRGMATAGLILGYVQFALLVLAICAIAAIAMLAIAGSTTSP